MVKCLASWTPPHTDTYTMVEIPVGSIGHGDPVGCLLHEVGWNYEVTDQLGDHDSSLGDVEL